MFFSTRVSLLINITSRGCINITIRTNISNRSDIIFRIRIITSRALTIMCPRARILSMRIRIRVRIHVYIYIYIFLGRIR